MNASKINNERINATLSEAIFQTISLDPKRRGSLARSEIILFNFLQETAANITTCFRDIEQRKCIRYYLLIPAT